jgi:hypothetical protein
MSRQVQVRQLAAAQPPARRPEDTRQLWAQIEALPVEAQLDAIRFCQQVLRSRRFAGRLRKCGRKNTDITRMA